MKSKKLNPRKSGKQGVGERQWSGTPTPGGGSGTPPTPTPAKMVFPDVRGVHACVCVSVCAREGLQKKWALDPELRPGGSSFSKGPPPIRRASAGPAGISDAPGAVAALLLARRVGGS